jgi:uncharacterized protein (DUF362 family)
VSFISCEEAVKQIEMGTVQNDSEKSLIKTENNNISIIEHQENRPLKASIKEVLESLGGIRNYVSQSDKVLLKPNFNTGDPLPGSTDPEFLLAVIDIIYSLTQNIKIVESSTLSVNTHKLIHEKVGAQLKDFNIPVFTEKEFHFTKVDLKSLGARYQKTVLFPDLIFDPEVKIILLPCMKTHFVAQFTGALKLAVGFMERKQRMRMHMSRKVPEKVAEINLGYKPHLILMDARKVFVTAGPAHGKVKTPKKFLAGTDRTAIDIEGVKIILSYKEKNKMQNLSPHEVRTIKRALELGIV